MQIFGIKKENQQQKNIWFNLKVWNKIYLAKGLNRLVLIVTGNSLDSISYELNQDKN